MDVTRQVFAGQKRFPEVRFLETLVRRIPNRVPAERAACRAPPMRTKHFSAYRHIHLDSALKLGQTYKWKEELNTPVNAKGG